MFRDPKADCPALWTVVITAFLLLGSVARADELSIDLLLAPNHIVDVSIEIPPKDWNELCEQDRDIRKVFSGSNENPFTYFKGDITIDGVTVRSVGIRKKGFIGSLDKKYPSLKVKFNEFVSQAPIPGIDNLTLNNNKQDLSLTSQFLAYQLFNSAGIRAPRCNFARVTVNGKYLGLYSNVESIGRPFLKRRFGNNTGNLYEGTLADFYPKAIDKLELKTNNDHYDATKTVRLATLLADSGPLALDEVEHLVDIDYFLRFWAMESLIGFWDGYTNNQNNYWVYENASNGKFYFMPWGADGAFMSGGFPGFGGGGQPVSVYAQSMLANRLYNDERIATQYRDTMRWALATIWNETELLESVDRVEQLISKELAPRQAGAPRAMRFIRDFIRTRRGKIEKELDAWPVRVAAKPRKPMYFVDIGSATGSFRAAWSEKPPRKVAESGSLSLKLNLDGTDVAFNQQGASVHRRPQGGFPFGFGGPPGPPGPQQPTADIVFAGIRESDGKTLTLTFPLDPNSLASHVGKELAIQGTIAEPGAGGPGFMPFGGKVVSGTLMISQAGTNPGDPIEANFELSINESRGGFMDRREQPRPERGAGGPAAGAPPGPQPGPAPGPPPGFPMFGMGPGGMNSPMIALCTIREVQDELSLTDDQRKQVQETQRDLGELVRTASSGFQEAFNLPENERMEHFNATRQKIEQVNRDADEKVRALLNETQRERLKQLRVQREGMNAFMNPEIEKSLELTEDQKEQMRSIREASQQFGPFAFGQTDEQRRSVINDVLVALTTDQRSKWDSLVGKEFRFPEPRFPGAGPGRNPADR